MEPIKGSLTIEEIYTKYPGLRRNTLDREGKRWHLWTAYNIEGPRAKEILDALYGEKDAQPSQPPVE